MDYTNYQTLALSITDDFELTGEKVMCNVKLTGLTIGDKEAYGTVTAFMIWDESENGYAPVDVVQSLLDDENERPLLVDNITLLEAMGDAYERFGNYFNSSDVKEL